MIASAEKSGSCLSAGCIGYAFSFHVYLKEIIFFWVCLKEVVSPLIKSFHPETVQRPGRELPGQSPGTVFFPLVTAQASHWHPARHWAYFRAGHPTASFLSSPLSSPSPPTTSLSSPSSRRGHSPLHAGAPIRGHPSSSAPPPVVAALRTALPWCARSPLFDRALRPRRRSPERSSSPLRCQVGPSA